MSGNYLSIRGEKLHCTRVDDVISDMIEFQGGLYSVVKDDTHPLYKIISNDWKSSLVMYGNTLYYAIVNIIGSDNVVRLYNVTDNSGEFKEESQDESTIPGWIVMDMKDMVVDVEDNTFIRWRYRNAGNNKTMDFRLNQVTTLPDISSNIIGQLFWSTRKSSGVVVSLNTKDTCDYEAGIYLCGDSKYMRLDFNENDPLFLSSKVKNMAIIGTSPHELALYSYGYYDDNGVWKENESGVDESALITKVNIEECFRHINVNMEEPDKYDMASEYIPSSISDAELVYNIERDEYGHIIRYDIMSNVNLRYKWEEI